MQLSQIYLYPIKSLAGIQVQQAKVTTRGLDNDRRFMLTTTSGMFLTQRKFAKMALLKINIEGDQMKIWHKDTPEDSIYIPLKPTDFSTTQEVTIWGDICTGQVLSNTINHWFSKTLNSVCQLVYMTDESIRPIEEKHRKEGEVVSFADAYPYLLLGQSSIDDLNNRLDNPVKINRFRPNLVFTGGQPFEEDKWGDFTIGGLAFRGTKPCARCNVLNINQETAKIEKEPNKTLATFRRLAKNKIYFGMNVCWEKAKSKGMDVIKIGDKIVR